VHVAQRRLRSGPRLDAEVEHDRLDAIEQLLGDRALERVGQAQPLECPGDGGDERRGGRRRAVPVDPSEPAGRRRTAAAGRDPPAAAGLGPVAPRRHGERVAAPHGRGRPVHVEVVRRQQLQQLAAPLGDERARGADALRRPARLEPRRRRVRRAQPRGERRPHAVDLVARRAGRAREPGRVQELRERRAVERRGVPARERDRGQQLIAHRQSLHEHRCAPCASVATICGGAPSSSDAHGSSAGSIAASWSAP
jgi:hypothetical protein